MKIQTTVLLLMAVSSLNAQKNFDGLVNAEKSFAAYSVAHGMKNAFLKFLDSNGIIFEQGKNVNGMEAWKKKENRPVVLNWTPQFAEAASSNDFGYTTGPWELRLNAGSDSVIAKGRYTTIWHTDANDEWKFLVDLGVGNSAKPLEVNLTRIKTKKITGEASTSEMLKAEQNFIELFKDNKVKAYQLYLSGQSILNRNGLSYPAIKKENQSQTIENTPSTIQFTVTGAGISSSGDLAYVYGNTIINGKSENYLHIWRKEKDGWRIALEVLRY